MLSASSSVQAPTTWSLMDFCWAPAPPGTIASPTTSAELPTMLRRYMVFLHHAFSPDPSIGLNPIPPVGAACPRAAYRGMGFSLFWDGFQQGGRLKTYAAADHDMGQARATGCLIGPPIT